MLGTGGFRAEVGKVKSDLAALCTALDPDSVPLPGVTSLWTSFDVIERLAAGAKTRLARRVEESRSWSAKGARSPAEHLAQLSGTTTGRARAALENSKRLAALPGTDEAVAKGELSEQQAEAITAAASADPSAEGRLLELAKRRDLRRLREEAARVQARAEDEAKRAERLHRQRSLRTWTGTDGSWNLMAKHTPEVGAVIEAALAPIKEAIFQAARRAGEHESGEAYGADALAEMARRSAAADDPVPHAGDARPTGEPRTDGHAGPEGDDQRDAGDDDQAGTGHDTGAAERPETAAGDTAADDTAADDTAAAGRAPARSRRPDTKGSSCSSATTPSSGAWPGPARRVRSPGRGRCRCPRCAP
jgi:hypothetical protein